MKRSLHNILAEAFDTPAEIDELLEEAGIPRVDLPPAGMPTPRKYWRTVVRTLETKGRVVDGMPRLLSAACELCPDNSNLAAFARPTPDAPKAVSPAPTKSTPTTDIDVLAEWRRHVATSNANLTAAFHRDGVPELLDHVYVELRVTDHDLLRSPREMATVGDEALGLGRLWKAGDGRLRLEELLRDSSPFPNATGRWLLYGDPGSGKTTLLRHLARKLALDDSAPWVPVFASLPRLARCSGGWLEVLCGDHQLAGLAPSVLREALDALGRSGRLLVLFDGLDEVPREMQPATHAMLGKVAEDWASSPVVVTSRPIGGSRPPGVFQDLELLAFREEDRLRFLERWLKDAGRALELLGRVRGESGLWELSGNPLYLTLLAMLFEEKIEIPDRRSDLYDRIFKHLLDGRHRPGSEPIVRQAVARGVLRFLAEQMTEDDLDSESVEDLEDRLWDADGLKAKLDKVARWTDKPRAFLEDVSEKTSILAAHDGAGNDWRYWHRTFREALASEALFGEMQRGGEAAVLEHAAGIEGNLGRWAEPYALLVGQVDVPDALVKTLMGVNRPLGLRALSSAQGLSEETFNEILGLTEDWQERAKVFRRIPELLGDAEASLRLIERLRRRSRDVHDLFFLEEATRLVGEEWPEFEATAERACAGFFADRPAPPADLFRWVEIPQDGGVELWREIEAGAFLMGTSAAEPDYDANKNPLGAFGNERPQHEVQITQPFQMMVVPVTNAMYSAFDPSFKPYAWGGVNREELGQHPAVNVDWYQAFAFCRWLSLHLGCEARLPREAEWEYACRAGTPTRFWSGDEEEDVARVGWYTKNSGRRTHRVGEKPANGWGLYDVHGNVYEWCHDEYNSSEYARREADVADPVKNGDVWSSSARRVVRGGSWAGPAWYLRAAYRGRVWPSNRYNYLGFRVCLSGPEHLDS